jgi:hypothetical protein
VRIKTSTERERCISILGFFQIIVADWKNFFEPLLQLDQQHYNVILEVFLSLSAPLLYRNGNKFLFSW